MKKLYLTFFIFFLIPFIGVAQQPVVARPNQAKPETSTPASKTSIPAVTPAQKVLHVGKKPRKSVTVKNAGKPLKPHHHHKVTASVYGNEWINYGQKYYKIKVVNDGLYRIDSLTLAKAGVPVNSINNANYQIFFQGQQQYIYIRSMTPNLSEKNGDYIEFFGQKNLGSIDSTLYYQIQFVPNPYYSLFNDTSTYYLTWGSTAGNRMVEQPLLPDTNNYGNYPITPYVIDTSISNVGSYAFGTIINVGGELPNDPRYTQGWSYTEASVWFGQSFTYTSPSIDHVYAGAAPNAFIRTVLVGSESGSCTFNVITNGTSGSFWINKTCNGFAGIDLDTTFPASNITVPYKITYQNTATSNTNIINPAYSYLSYPRIPNLDGDSTHMVQVPYIAPSNTTLVEFTNIGNAGTKDTIWMYDLTYHNRMWVRPSYGFYKAIVPATSSGNTQCFLSTDLGVHKVTRLVPVGMNYSGTFTNLTSGPDSAFIIVTHASLDSGAEAYEKYRQKRYNTVLVNVDELYDQFGYGVDYSPLGIRRFCNYAIVKWPSIPSNLFLIGKGIHSFQYRYNPVPEALSEALVPSMGFPSSDILLTSGLNGDSITVPAIPTGRLAALSNGEIATYLDKVETFESQPAAQWMKKVAHFVGGSSAPQAYLYESWMDQFASVISDTLFGANVYTFTKSSPAPITSSLTDSVENLINGGVSIMTFFGHAGGADWDESVDYPSDYTNYNKYPLMIADACFSGDIFQPVGEAITSVSEQWVLGSPGAIGFFASDYLGIDNNLRTYTTYLYNNISYRPFYRQPIGVIVQNTNEQQAWDVNPIQEWTCLEMTLHGDPAITLNAMDSLPDYAVTNQSIYFTPGNVTVLMDSFKVNVIVYNYAEALYQNVSGVLTRTEPDGSQFTYPFTFTNLWNTDTAVITMPVDRVNGVGLNYFTVKINLNPTIDAELTLNNNKINSPGVPLWITSEDITPVWPYDFAIIPSDTVTLKASTDDPFAPRETYIFEIDTSHRFNSPVFQSILETNSGGVIMASPFDAWGTTHYAAPVKHEPVKNGKELTLKGMENQKSLSENNGNVKGKINNETNNTAGQPIAEQNKNPGSKEMPVQIKGQPQINVGIKGQKGNNLDMDKQHLRVNHGPIRQNAFVNPNGKTVYYWRVRRDTADTVKYPWAYSSFQYINNRNGWGQSDFYQYINDEQFLNTYDFIDTNSPKRDWVFNTNGHTLVCNDFGVPMASNIYIHTADLEGTGYYIDDVLQAYAGCQLHYEIDIAVINPTSLTPWNTKYFADDFGNANDSLHCITYGCTWGDNKFIFWADDTTQMRSLANMLKTLRTNPIYNGYYLLAWSWIEGEYKMAGNNVVTQFADLGCTQMPVHASTPGLDSVPFIFFTQIGNPSAATQVFGTNDTSAISLTYTMKSNGTYGAITTPLIGPSAKYDSLSWYQHSYDHTLTDSTRLNVIGVEPSGDTKVLLSGVTPAATSMYLSSINATMFPYIQLQLYTKDVVNHTPGQMNWWRVFYQPVPEIAMNPNIYSYFHADTISYGDTVRFQTTVQNISNWPIDSTRLLTWITNQNNAVSYVSKAYATSEVPPLSPGQSSTVSMWWPDSAKSNNPNQFKSIWFEVNPEDFADTRLEQYHFNDYAKKTYYSFGDKINPVLDVTFDGIHILNNDIVSPTPNILITFMDENKYLALNNPSDFQVYLRNINSTTPVLQSYGPTLSFTPAVLPHNKCSMLFTPTLVDGTYELTVQGKDISGNFSAANTYKIDFQVINKSMISEVLNYPNPFTTSTRFVFILTGDQIPTTFKIQIMTVTGKIVREINESEIGPIHIGRNITQYAWDGTDQFGSKLANGVYLYRVVSSINGQSIDDYQTSADQYFTKNWGKMYLMR